MMPRPLRRLPGQMPGWLPTWVAFWLFSVPLFGGEIIPLSGTKPLDWNGDLASRMMDGLHRYVERAMDRSIVSREKFWKREGSSPQAYEKSVEPNRQRLKKILGVVDARMPARMERFGDEDNPALVAQTELYCVYQVRWPVLEGVSGEGLLLEPAGPVLGQAVAHSGRGSDARATGRPRPWNYRGLAVPWPSGVCRYPRGGAHPH